MSNKQETKEQKVVIVEGNGYTVIEEKKVGFIKGTYVLVPFYRGAVVFYSITHI